MKQQKNAGSSKFYRAVYAMFAGLVKILFNIRVIDGQNEPDEGGYLICGNHVSATDAVVMCYAFKKNQARLMAKKELFKIPVLAQLIKLLGAFPIDRSGGDIAALKKAISMIKEGKSIGIFPQGHRYPGVDPRTTPVKNGVGLIARRAGCAVVPVYIMRKNNTFRLFKKTYIIIGESISAEDLAGLDNTAVAELVFNRICTLGENAAKDERIKL
jgi:1-acyl-sn-glycerol-3-phosphate acyltransferase